MFRLLSACIANDILVMEVVYDDIKLKMKLLIRSVLTKNCAVIVDWLKGKRV